MTVAKVTSTSYGNLGIKGTRMDNEMTAITGVILSTPAFIDSIADIAKEATWIAGVKAGTVFPLTGLDSYEDQSSDDTIYESPLQKRKLLKRGKKRFMFQLDAPFSVHRTLQEYFNNADLTIWIIRDGKLCFYNHNGQAEGFGTSMMNIGMMKEVPADGSTPAFTPLYIDINNYREWDMYGEFLEMSWNIDGLKSLTDVEIEVVGTPGATSIVVKVYAADGYDSAGAVKEVLINGLVVGDFKATKTNGDDQTSALNTRTNETGTGTYTIACTGLANGSIDLKLPANMTSGVAGDLLIKSTGAATITIP